MKMFSRIYKAKVVILLLILFLIPLTALANTGQSSQNSRAGDIQDRDKQVREAYGNLPLYFIQNDGQIDSRVKFYEKGGGHVTFFTNDGVYLSLTRKAHRDSGSSSLSLQNHSPQLGEGNYPLATEVIKLNFLNANKNPEIISSDRQDGKVNYFIGKDTKKWRTNVPTYRTVVYKEVYPGIDIKFYGNNKQMEYDIIVRPGADPSIVRFSYDGIAGLKITDEGDIEISLNSSLKPDQRNKIGKIFQKKPVLYQVIDGKRVVVQGAFKLIDKSDFAFEVSSYDKEQPLVIDPVLIYSTYLGGGGNETGQGIAVDGSGSAYVTGSTDSVDFPTTVGAYDTSSNGMYDLFVAKFDPTGSALIYATYLGGSDQDYGQGIALDANNNAYVTGATRSADFPATPGAFDTTYSGGALQHDAVVAKLDPLGVLVYATYLGGANDDWGYGIALRDADYAYVTGKTASSDFPTTTTGYDASYNGGMDLFVTELNSTGSALLYSTFLGGSGNDWGYGIIVVPSPGGPICGQSLNRNELGIGIAAACSGLIYVTGRTESQDFPATTGTFKGNSDIVVAKLLDSEGSAGLYWANELGGSGWDTGKAIAVDGAGNSYVTGETDSTDFPVTPAAYDTSFNGWTDIFAVKLDSTSSIVYATYLGGNGEDSGYGIAADAAGNAYLTGGSNSDVYPTSVAWDVFIAKLNPTGSSLAYYTYLGGLDSHDSGYGIAADSAGNAYLTGVTGSADFPTTPGAYDTSYNSGSDVFVSKINTLYLEENNLAITYNTPGLWVPYVCPTCSGGGLKYSNFLGAQASLSFDGTGIKWRTVKGPMMGKARVYIDGVNMGLVDLYNPTTNLLFLQKTGLTAGSHTATIEVSGQKNPGATDTNITLDAFKVLP